MKRAFFIAISFHLLLLLLFKIESKSPHETLSIHPTTLVTLQKEETAAPQDLLYAQFEELLK